MFQASIQVAKGDMFVEKLLAIATGWMTNELPSELS